MEPKNLCAIIDDTLDTSSVDNNVASWLCEYADGCAYLLAHAEDGVIWGRFNDGTLVIAADVFPSLPTDYVGGLLARLDAATLWQCRIFGPDVEVMLWRSDQGWRARRITDQPDPKRQSLTETQILWGDHAEQREQGFTLLADGSQGLRHALPHEVPATTFNNPQNPRPMQLVVRHYLEEDQQTGVSRIAHSRLVNVTFV